MFSTVVSADPCLASTIAPKDKIPTLNGPTGITYRKPVIGVPGEARLLRVGEHC